MAMDATPNAILRLRSGERTQPGGLRDGGRGCITAAQAGLANRASQAERTRVPSGNPRALTGKRTPHIIHYTLTHQAQTRKPRPLRTE